MSYLSRGWESMTPRERIVAMSLASGSLVAIVNSTVWAIATCYMSRQRAQVQLAHERATERIAAPSVDEEQEQAGK